VNCPNYEPSEKMGKHRPICKWWNASNNGSCNRQDKLMCSEWIAKQFNGKIVEVKGRV
jgi:hypothetical protein